MIFQKEDYIRFRIERAYESLDEAVLLAGKDHWNTVASRLYYACFYIVTALLLKHDMESKTHSGTRSSFHRLISTSNDLGKELGDHYSILFDLRHFSDYEIMFYTKKEVAEPLISRTRHFIDAINNKIVEK